jgi:putative lipoic acid-binding regulatory protein
MAAEQDSGNQEAPRIEFPCSYPIKVIGKAAAGYEQKVIAVLEKHAGKMPADLIQIHPSKQQNYLSISVTIMATGEDQLRKLFLDLKTIESVKMVL